MIDTASITSSPLYEDTISTTKGEESKKLKTVSFNNKEVAKEER